MITLVLADDHPLIREGIRSILSKTPDIRIIGEAQDGHEAQKLVEQLQPQILLLDLEMPGPMSVQIAQWVRTNCPKTVTLVLTAPDPDAYLAAMLSAGVAGYLTMNESQGRLLDVIRRAARGEKLLTGEQYERMLKWREDGGNKWGSLTVREREVLQLLLQGMDNASIANLLGIKPKTVALHMTNIFEKIGVRSREEAMVWAHRYMTDNLE